MAHPTKEEILRASEGGWAEIERLALHLSACSPCRALASGVLADRAPTGKRVKVLKVFVEIARLEKTAAVEGLLAKADLADLRRLTKGAQREKVMLSRSCHSLAFIEILVSALYSLRTSAETEALANLAQLAAQGMDPAEAGEAFKNDLLAGIWIELANTRRIRAEWLPARAALLRADKFRESGTSDPCVKARWLSIAGSLQCDQGNLEEAMACLEECQRAYAARSEWTLVGRTFILMAHCMTDHDPESAITFLDRASVYISAQDAEIRSLAERIRADCLMNLEQLDAALHAFADAELLRPEYIQPRAAVYSNFLAARLLESLGHLQGAEALFDAVVADDLELGLFKNTVLDLVYVFGFHLHLGSLERVARLGLLVLGELDRQDSAASEQFRSVLTQLTEAAHRGRLDETMLRAARDSLGAQWKHPASSDLWHGSGAASASSPARSAVIGDRRLVEPLIARALWSSLRLATRREQLTRVARSPEFHTTAFVELLLAGIRRTHSRDEAEFRRAWPCRR